MSYRNPQQYGIVEDMTAGVKAFQQGFGQVAGAIEKVKQDREKEEIRRDASNANWVLTTEQDLAKYEYLSDGYQDLMRDMVTKDVGSEFFDKKSKTKQAMLLRKLQKNAEFGNDFFELVGKVKNGEIELDNPEMMKYIDSVENNPKYALDKDNDPTLNGVKLSVIMAEMKKNEPVTGSEAEYSQRYLDTRKRIEETIESEQKTLGGKLSQERINQIIDSNIDTELISHPSAHWTYKNKIQGNSQYGDVANTNYIGGGVSKEGMIDFEKQRNSALKQYYQNLLGPSIISKGISKSEDLSNQLKIQSLEDKKVSNKNDNFDSVKNYVDGLYKKHSNSIQTMGGKKDVLDIDSLVKELNQTRSGGGGYTIRKQDNKYLIYNLNDSGNLAMSPPIEIDFDNKEQLARILSGKLLSKTEYKKTMLGSLNS